jgi:RNA polymerase sigma-70 factor, ECF subfamily
VERSKHDGLSEYARNLIRRKARQLIGKYGFNRDDCEDLMQELTLDLLIRLSKFDASKACLDTFVSRIVDRRVANVIRYQRQVKRDFHRRAPSLDEPIRDDEGRAISRGERISQDEYDLRMGKYTSNEAEREEMRMEVGAAISGLPWDLQLLANLLRTHSMTEAARKLGVHRDTLYSARLPRLRQIFEDKGLREYL